MPVIKLNMTKEESIRIDLLRFPLIVFVVFIHAYNAALVFSGENIGVNQEISFNLFFQNLISNEIGRCAVPLFFFMSGYLFFYGNEWSSDIYMRKIMARTRTLLIPFIFWNSLTLIFFALVQSIAAAKPFFSGNSMLVINYGIKDYLVVFFGIGRMPISYQFWFIRDLMVLVMLSKLIHFFVKKYPALILLLFFVLWLLNFGFTLIESGLFFSLGAYLSISNRSFFMFDTYVRKLLPIYISMLIFDALFPFSEIYIIFHKVSIVIGVMTFIFLSGVVVRFEKIKKSILSLGASSFFVYAAHEPLLTVFRKVPYKIFQARDGWFILMLYFLSVIIVVYFLVYIYRFLSNKFPIFIGFITGGR